METLEQQKKSLNQVYKDDILAFIGLKHCHMGYWHADNNDDFTRAQEDHLVKIVEPLGIKSGDRILDIGGGQGGTSIWLAKNYKCNVIIVEVVENMVWEANKEIQKQRLENQVQTVCSDILKFEGHEENFDHIISVEALHHIYDKENLFKKIASLLKPGGKFAASIDLCYLNPGVLRKIYSKLILGDGDISPLDHYAEAIKKSNLDQCETEDISDAVFSKSMKMLMREPYYSKLVEYHRKHYGRLLTLLFPLFAKWHNSVVRKKQLGLVICRAQKTEPVLNENSFLAQRTIPA